MTVDILVKEDFTPLVSVFWFRLLLLNQFHDVLPGSCIQLVVEDALQNYTGQQEAGHFSGPSLSGGAAEVSVLNFQALWVFLRDALSDVRNSLAGSNWGCGVAQRSAGLVLGYRRTLCGPYAGTCCSPRLGAQRASSS